MNKPPLKIAMITRPNLYTAPGGDTVQVLKTAEYLKEHNVQADIILDKKVHYNNYNLLHFFNVICPEDILGHIYKTNVPFVLSTIYVDYSEYDTFHRQDVLGFISRFIHKDRVAYIKTLAKFILKSEKVSTIGFFIKGHKSSIKYIIKESKTLLPNSNNEYKRLFTDYKIHKNYTIVPNAIETSLFKYNSSVTRDIVLCVGRIEGNKGQLNIIRALKDSTYKIYFIGSAAPNQASYYNQCRKEATANMTFIDFIPQTELVSYYNRAKVHILASWFETTGLSNLEAGIMGCNLVVGDRGDVRDYFEDLVIYCEPGNLQSIKEAVDRAWNTLPNPVLQEKIKNNYTWQHAAKATFEAYQNVLNIQ